MAERHWVGGTATWDATAGTKWALTNGGAGGEAVPTAADDVYFDSGSGAVTVTTTSAVSVCRSLNCTGFTGTLSIASTATGLSVGDASGGAFTLSAGMTFTVVSTAARVVFVSTNDNGGAGWPITFAGKVVPHLTFNGVGGKWVLQDAVNGYPAMVSNPGLTLTSGHLDTNNQSINMAGFSVTGTVARTLTLGSSYLTLYNNNNAWTGTTLTNFTMTANTGTIFCGGDGNSFRSPPFNYNGASLRKAGSGSTLPAGCTFKDVTLDTSCQLTSSITATGTFTMNGTNSTTGRFLLSSVTTGSPVTVTAAAVAFSNADFMDITGAGAANWNLSAITGLSGDCLGNSGITFTTPADRFAVAIGVWSSTSVWANSSGGLGGTRVPLPQDNVIFDANSPTGGGSPYSIDMLRAGKNLTCTGFTGWIRVTLSTQFFGSVVLGAGMVWYQGGGGEGVSMMGRGSNTFTSNGVAMQYASNRAMIFGCCAASIYTLNDAFVGLAGPFYVAAGSTFNTGNNSMTITTSTSGNGMEIQALSVVNFGTSVVTHLIAGSSFTLNMSATAIVDADEATFVIGDASSGARTWVGGNHRYGELRYTVANSPGGLTISGNNHFGTLDIGPGRTLAITAGSSQNVDTWDVDGESRDYIYLPGSNGHNMTTPDSAALSITGDLDMRAKVTCTWDTQNQAFVTKWATTGSQLSYFLGMSNTTSGRILFSLSTNGSTGSNATSTASVPFSGTSTGWVRATRVQSSGVVTFYTSSDGSSWTPLGSTVVLSTSAIFDSTTSLMVGASADGSLFNGRMYRAQIRNNVLDDGTGIVFDADLSTKTFGANTFTESSSNAATVTVNGTLAQVGDGRVAIASTTASAAAVAKPTTDSHGNKWLYRGTTGLTMAADGVSVTGGGYVITPASAGIAVTGDIDVRWYGTLSDWTPASQMSVISKVTAAGAIDYLMEVASWGVRFYWTHSSGGTNDRSTLTPLTLTDGVAGWVRCTLDVDNGSGQHVLSTYQSTDGNSWTSLGTSTYAGVTNIRASSNSFLVSGTQLFGSGNPLTGAIGRLEIRDGIAGTVVTDPQFGRGIVNRNISDYVTVTANRALGEATWYAEPPSADGGTNYGWNFDFAPLLATSVATTSTVGAALPSVMVTTITTTTSIDAPNINTITHANVAATAVDTVSLVGTSVVSGVVDVVADVIVTTSAIDAPTISASATAETTTLATDTSIDAPLISTSEELVSTSISTVVTVDTPVISASSTVLAESVATAVLMPSPAPTMGGSGYYIRGRLTITVRERTMGIVVREAVEVAP